MWYFLRTIILNKYFIYQVLFRNCFFVVLPSRQDLIKSKSRLKSLVKVLSWYQDSRLFQDSRLTYASSLDKDRDNSLAVFSFYFTITVSARLRTYLVYSYIFTQRKSIVGRLVHVSWWNCYGDPLPWQKTIKNMDFARQPSLYSVYCYVKHNILKNFIQALLTTY